MKSFILAATLAIAGVSSAYASAELALTSADNGTAVEVAAGGTVTLALPSQGGVPYAWTITSEIEPVLSPVSEDKVAVTPGMIGGPANTVFTLSAAQAGTVELSAGYFPFTGGGPAEKTVTVTVTVTP